MIPLLERVRAAVKAHNGEVLHECEEAIAFRGSGGQAEITMDLERLRRAARDLDPGEVAVLVEERVQAALRAAEPDPGLALDGVLPHLLPWSGGGPWSRPLVQDRLRLGLVQDGPQTLRYVQPMELVRAGLGLPELDVRCRDNLFRLAPQGRWCRQPDLGPEVLACEVGDGHDAARVLVAERWFPDESRLLCLVPSRDHLWVVPGSVPDAETKALGLRVLARDFARESAYPLSDQVFVNQTGKLGLLIPSAP